MKLEVFDKKSRERIDIIRVYTFAQYENEYTGTGSFSVVIPSGEDIFQNLLCGNYILFDDGIVGIIKGMRNYRDEDTEIEVYGSLTNCILKYRSFLTTKKYYDTVGNISRSMVTDMLIDTGRVERNIDFIKLSDDPAYIPAFNNKITFQNTGDTLLDVLSKMFMPYGLGFALYPVISNYDEETGELYNLSSMEFRILSPVDRTIDNPDGNVPIVFSFDLDNLTSLEYEEDEREYCTVAIVAGEGTGSSRKVIEVGDLGKSGIDRVELYVDARDIQSEQGTGGSTGGGDESGGTTPGGDTGFDPDKYYDRGQIDELLSAYLPLIGGILSAEGDNTALVLENEGNSPKMEIINDIGAVRLMLEKNSDAGYNYFNVYAKLKGESSWTPWMSLTPYNAYIRDNSTGTLKRILKEGDKLQGDYLPLSGGTLDGTNRVLILNNSGSSSVVDRTELIFKISNREVLDFLVKNTGEVGFWDSTNQLYILQVSSDTFKHNGKKVITENEVPFKFGIDENGNYGYYKKGETTLTPFNSGSNGGGG